MKKTKLNLWEMNDSNLEKEQMNQVFGGAGGSSPCTTDTITVTPTGSKNDGDDSWDGECDDINNAC